MNYLLFQTFTDVRDLVFSSIEQDLSIPVPQSPPGVQGIISDRRRAKVLDFVLSDTVTRVPTHPLGK